MVGTKIATAVRPTAVAAISTIGGHVRYGIQVSASAFDTTKTDAAAAAQPIKRPETTRIIVCQKVIDSSCRVVAPTRRSSKSAPRLSTVAMTRGFTSATAASNTTNPRKRLFAYD